MSLEDISNPESVNAAIAEFQRMGRSAFLKRYGFGRSREYYLVRAHAQFDSKAIVGAAHGFEFPDRGPLRPSEFSGGESTVARKLRDLGFSVKRVSDTSSGRLASQLLIAGAVYTREDLKRILDTQDATINTGVFHPTGFSSVLVFVTKNKTSDRTQYKDSLDGNTLHWQGQSRGRTDAMIVEHQLRGLELLVFRRNKKYQHPGAGFLYLGRFNYVRHSGKNPTDFVLYRASLDLGQAATKADRSGEFDPSSVEDARQKTIAAIVRRQGQPAFRRALFAAYEGRCAVTRCAVPEALEAAHIISYQGPETNHVTNGLLLRADLHTLFDLGLLAVNEAKFASVMAPILRGTEYAKWSGKSIYLPKARSDQPSADALRLHRESAGL